MELNEGIHLAYCTNIHRGEGWDETFKTLEDYTLRVRAEVCPDLPYAIGLRLGHSAALELNDSRTDNLKDFKAWLDKNNCYVFTINGFPYGQFHGARVKEQVYRPDWTHQNRVDYTNLLFDILVKLLPPGIAGSVSTLPGSFKEFISDDGAQGDLIVDNIAQCGDHISSLVEKTGMDLHLGLEPEPLGWFETTAETVDFFDRFRSAKGGFYDSFLGVNYDTCHLAIEFESAVDAFATLKEKNIRISKLHLSSALRLSPAPQNLKTLKGFEDDVYLHQVVAKTKDGSLQRYRDLPDALECAMSAGECNDEEWRVHFHIPLHSSPGSQFNDTRDHIEDVLDLLKDDPSICQHLEMETYTWEVLPEEMQSGDVVEQLVKEYQWTLDGLKRVGLV
ncbi:MAG: metabolite traffic protein EboE [Akkermansiaceae bacterium]|jgi:sugar phosphate isomerase/epimerase|nr:metabolite traffic protein EboE [Akkermansiaceae bacterium]